MDAYISIDLETTGTNPKTDKIIEIGALKVKDGAVTERFSTFVNPGRKLDARIVELTGITDEMLHKAPIMDEVLPELLEFLEDLPLLGHSIISDFSFLKKAVVDRKMSFERCGVDTLKIARKFLPELEHRNLGFLCDYYGIPIQAHRAMNDAEATQKLYLKLVENFFSEEEKLFVPKPLLFHVRRDTPATKPQKERLSRLLAQYEIVLDMDVEALTRSEASRLTDQILSQYRIR